MKKRKLLNYFKNFALMQIIGGVVLAVGFLIWWYAFEIWFLGTPIMLVGIALLATGGILKVGDKDYEEHFKLLMRDFIRRELEQKPYKSFCGFECEGEQAMQSFVVTVCFARSVIILPIFFYQIRS